ncbi:MAG TPA: hypothetical protein VGI10_31230 [Polyangiaceae bacterium]
MTYRRTSAVAVAWLLACGCGGTDTGSGGASAGNAGNGGASAGNAGNGGASAGNGGASAGNGGASAGSGGASAGSGGASAGNAGSGGEVGCVPACDVQSVCVRTQTVGGCVSCMSPPSFACAKIPAGCGATVDCTCASALCGSRSCQAVAPGEAGQLNCLLLAP